MKAAQHHMKSGEDEVKLRSQWGGKRESVLDRLKAKSLLEDSIVPGNSQFIRAGLFFF